MASNSAPNELELVRLFVNTYDVDEQKEDLATPAALRAWLAEHGLLPDPKARITAADVAHAQELREALRAILLHHGGIELDPAAPRALDDAARRAQLAVAFDPHGDATVEPQARGVDGALGRLLTLVTKAQQEGTWHRLKACSAESCQWAFYDRSRNRSAVWCDMKVCGNRHKVRSFRERQGAAAHA